MFPTRDVTHFLSLIFGESGLQNWVGMCMWVSDLQDQPKHLSFFVFWGKDPPYMPTMSVMYFVIPCNVTRFVFLFLRSRILLWQAEVVRQYEISTYAYPPMIFDRCCFPQAVIDNADFIITMQRTCLNSRRKFVVTAVPLRIPCD